MLEQAEADAVRLTPETIKRLRRELGELLHGEGYKMSQSELGRILGVEPVTVNRWERGHHPPSPILRQRLIAALSYVEMLRRSQGQGEKSGDVE